MAEYICREMAIKKLQMQLLDLEADQDKGEYSELCENRGARDALDEAIYDIRTIKSADVQPVKRGTAEYMHTLYTLRFIEVYKCSACGGKIEMNADRHTPYSQGNKPKFCPNCGARMDGDAE